MREAVPETRLASGQRLNKYIQQGLNATRDYIMADASREESKLGLSNTTISYDMVMEAV